MAVFVLIVVGMLEMFDFVRLTYVKGERKLDVQQNTRLVTDTMAREFRMAGYFPENFDTNTASDLAGTATGIHVAAANSLAISGDLAGNCNPTAGACPDYSSKVYLYCQSGTTVIRKITNFTTPTSGTPDASAYTCGGGDILAENINGLTFSYYDINNVLLTPLPLDAANRGNVATVIIALIGQETVPGPGQLPQTFTLTQTVRLRNLNSK
jgi:Tfp pilus assembly protein PilW